MKIRSIVDNDIINTFILEINANLIAYEIICHNFNEQKTHCSVALYDYDQKCS